MPSKHEVGCSGSGRSNLLKNKKIRPKNRRFQGLCRTFRHQKERYRILSFSHIALSGPEKIPYFKPK
ncbi:MAG: hypothetical protein DRI57_22940 [Deltaproteobacteria bacterium]|nr:MAG: hypothetical protein DRI57_22940 [Deltaproteobacteria bacterium]